MCVRVYKTSYADYKIVGGLLLRFEVRLFVGEEATDESVHLSGARLSCAL